MLTLAMALVAAPRLLMIDELSLGLAPEITRRLHDRLRDLRGARNRRSSSWNSRSIMQWRSPTAPTSSTTAPSGTPARPPASSTTRSWSTRPSSVPPRPASTTARVRHGRAGSATGAGADDRVPAGRRHEALRRCRRARRRVADRRPGRDRRRHRPERRRQDDPLRRGVRLRARRCGDHRDVARRRHRRRHADARARTRPARARSLVPGRPALSRR